MARFLLNLKEVDRPIVSQIMMKIIKRNFANVARECGMDEWKLFSLVCSHINQECQAHLPVSPVPICALRVYAFSHQALTEGFSEAELGDDIRTTTHFCTRAFCVRLRRDLSCRRQ